MANSLATRRSSPCVFEYGCPPPSNRALPHAFVRATKCSFRNWTTSLFCWDLKLGVYFGLDAVGTRIWQLFGEHELLSDIAKIVAEMTLPKTGAPRPADSHCRIEAARAGHTRLSAQIWFQSHHQRSDPTIHQLSSVPRSDS